MAAPWRGNRRQLGHRDDQAASEHGEDLSGPATTYSTHGPLPPVTRDEWLDTPTASDRAFGAGREEQAREQELAPEESDWEPEVQHPETKLEGTYGDYVVRLGFVPGKVKKWGLRCEITMSPNAKASAQRIAFVQVSRRASGRDDRDWATEATDQGMDPVREKRTDSKTGFRLDRPFKGKVTGPFYGLDKGKDGSTKNSAIAKIGKHGGDAPWMRDTPEMYAQDQLEFVTTATDMDTGMQYDAITWGGQIDEAGKGAATDPPTIIKAGDERMAGRDRAINKWNTDIAGPGIDKVPTTADPAAVAKTLSGMIAADDDAHVVETLRGVTDPELRKRVAACYKLETGTPLSKDLEQKLSRADRKKLAGWL